MTKFKNLAVVTLTALLLAACGNDSQPQQEESKAPETEQETPVKEEKPKEEKTADNGMKIGETTEEAGFGKSTLLALQDINQDQTTGNFKVSLKSLGLSTIEPEETAKEFLNIEGDTATLVVLELAVSHDSDETEAIYPNQSTLVTNNGSQVDANLLVSDDIGGDFLGKVNKEGKVSFILKDDPETIDNIRLIIGAPHDENFSTSGEDLEFSVDIDK